MKIYDDGISLTRNGYIFTDYFTGLSPIRTDDRRNIIE